MQPLGVYRSRTADHLGRDIFFVAACRALGIPARINEINGKVQYYEEDWTDVTLDAPSTPANAPSGVAVPEDSLSPSITPTGALHLTYTPTPYLPDAKYYTHFTLSRLDANGILQLLTYPEEATFQNTFATGVTLDTGTYLLTTGIRMADGSVRANLQFFNILPDATTTLPLTLRTATDAVAVIGSLNAEDLYQPLTPPALNSPSPTSPTSSSDSESEKLSTLNSTTTLHSQLSTLNSPSPTSLLSTCGRGYYALGLIAPNQEPTNHALRDIALVRNDFEQWGRKLVLLFDDADAASRFNFQEIQGLPSTTVWGTDIDATIKKEVIEQLHLPNTSLPIFLICDSFNRVVFVQQGYTIGLGEQFLKTIHQL